MRWCVAACAIALTACSFVGVRPSPQARAGEPKTCSTYVLPTLDLLVPVVAGGVAFSMVVDNICGSERCVSKEDMRQRMALLGSVGLLALASAVYGFAAEKTCRRRLHTMSSPATLTP